MPIPELVGSAEAAKLLEIGPTNFSHLRKKMVDAGDENFPTPIARLQCGPIWTERDMLKFKKHYDSRRRRTRSTNGDSAATVEPAPKAAKAKAAPAKKTAVAKVRTPRKAAAKTAGTATVTDIKAPAAKRLRVKAPV